MRNTHTHTASVHKAMTSLSAATHAQHTNTHTASVHKTMTSLSAATHVQHTQRQFTKQ